MPDFFYLTGPQGTMLNLGSWLRADPGPDFGARDVPKQTYAENALAEGGVLAYESVGVRRMSFPLLLASGGAGLSLDGLAGVLREVARPGAYIDLQPVNVPTGEMVRFDVLGGRVQQSGFTAGLQRVARRNVDVELDVQPYGYWPTTILLASGVATAAPFTLAIPAASIVGDAPGLARIIFAPSFATAYGPLSPSQGFWSPDGFWYTLERTGGRPYMTPSDFFVATDLLVPSAINGYAVASDSFAPFGAKRTMVIGPGISGGGSVGRWAKAFTAGSTLVDALNNTPTAYRGRWRVFAAMRLTPSMGTPWMVTSDEAVLAGPNVHQPLASAYPIATLLPQANPSYTDSPTAMYQYLDLGEHTWPLQPGSGGADGMQFRIWAFAGPSGVPSVPTATLELGGVFLQKLGQSAGMAGRGWIVPTTYNVIATSAPNIVSLSQYDMAKVVIDSIGKQMTFAEALPTNLGSHAFLVSDARKLVSGQFPLIATGANLDIGIFHRRWGSNSLGATNATAIGGTVIVTASIEYRPRFTFLKGL